MDCPHCSSAHTKRCEVLYAQGTSMSFGPEYSAFNVSGMASRVSPPSPPTPPSYFKRRLVLMGIPGLLLCLLSVGLFLMLWANKGLSSAPGGLVPGVLGAYLLWQAWPPQGSLSDASYQVLCDEYVRNLRLYQTLWACTDCGHVFQPATVGRT